MGEKIIIIGGSAAGPKVASKIRRMDQEAEITIIQKGKYLSMASCGYPYFVGGVFDNLNQLISTPTGAIRDPHFFSKVKAINALVETEAISINKEKKTITVRDLPRGKDKDLSYDKLVLTTGASPVKPPIPGISLEGIDALQSMEDAVKLKSVAKEKRVKKALIVGGGLIGIETCEALNLAGIEITVVEMLDQILPFLDWEMAKLVENHMKAKGVRVVTSKAVTRFIGDNGKVSAVEIDGGEMIPTDHVVLSIGVKPNTKLAFDAGLKIGESGGISVNRFLQTSDPSIYAAGDCIEVVNLITHNKQHWPMGDAANLQGRIVAQNVIHGNREEYNGVYGTGICKVFDFTAGSTGLSKKMAKIEGFENVITAIHAAPDKPGFMGASPVVIKMIAAKSTGKILGMQAVGTGDISKRVAMAAMALHGRLCITNMVNLDLPYAPPFSPAIDNLLTAVHVLENKWRKNMDSISSVEFMEKLNNKNKPFILDVRGMEEFETMRLGIGETLIPLGTLRDNFNKLPEDRDREIVTYCKISLRGYEASCILKANGFTNVKVLVGGIIAWPYSREK
jgi:NADPH-dependent 2,4-dienoyl-CoA reductase/sulfur reductase-like enzyme/rhodanese-related sulfurtransferase